MTPENAPSEFLYRPAMGRIPINNVPPLLASTLPHISEDPDAVFEALSNTVPYQPKQSVEEHHSMLFGHVSYAHRK